MPENPSDHFTTGNQAPAGSGNSVQASAAKVAGVRDAPPLEGLLERLSRAVGQISAVNPATNTSDDTAAGPENLDALLDTLAGDDSVAHAAQDAAQPDAPPVAAMHAMDEMFEMDQKDEDGADLLSHLFSDSAGVSALQRSFAASEPSQSDEADAQAKHEAPQPDQDVREIGEVLSVIDAELGALEIAPETRNEKTQVVTQQVVFQLAGTNYAVPIGEVLEMSTVPKTTSLPNVPDFVRGVTNLRGEVLAVIDLRMFLGLAITGDPMRERMLVVRPPGSDAVAGLIVESVRGLARIANQQLRPPAGPLEDPVVSYLVGVTEYENQVLHALDLQKLFLAPEIASLSAQ